MFFYDVFFEVKPLTNRFISKNVTDSNNIFMRGIWFSYLDWLNLIDVSTVDGKVSEENLKKNVDLIFNNLKSIGINSLFLNVRAFGDAFYPSKLVYRSKFLKNLDLNKIDPLKIFVDCAKMNKIKIHGWINPMRVFKGNDFEYLPDGYILKKWFVDEKLRNNYFIGADSYNCWVLNPCNEEVVNLIVSAEQELLQNYELDGIHIDDYFFPSNINKTKYDVIYYNNRAPGCDLETFRFEGTSNLVKKMRDKCHEIRPNSVFGAAIIGNFNVNKGIYADVEGWLKYGLVDYLIPEIYYSFNNRLMPFDRCVQEWNSLLEKHGSDLKIYVGLAAYRIGEAVSKNDSGWQNSGTILKEQQNYCKNNLRNYSGYCLFDYKTIFNKNGNMKPNCRKELESLNLCFK